MRIGHVENELGLSGRDGASGRLAAAAMAAPLVPMVSVAMLLVGLFLLMLRLYASEGALAARAPAASRPVAEARPLPTVKVRLRASAKGRLESIAMNGRQLDSLDELRSELREMARAAGGSPEVELDCDYQLDYAYTMKAITAVSSYLAEDGKTPVKLVERVKFAPRRGP